MDGVTRAISSGSLMVALPLAVVAGLVSFLSPCTLPLLPGYLGFVSGLSGPEVVGHARAHRRRLVFGAVLFVVGFSSILIGIALTLGGLAREVPPSSPAVRAVLGVMAVLFGLLFLVAPRVGRQINLTRYASRVGLLGAPMFGALFAIGWTPCLGPALGAMMSLAYIQHDMSRAVVLLSGYSAGLGLPFVGSALALERALRTSSAVRRRQRVVSAIGASALIAIGGLILVGAWDDLLATVQAWLSNHGGTVPL